MTSICSTEKYFQSGAKGDEELPLVSKTPFIHIHNTEREDNSKSE
jgi:hypothetical protein